MWWNWVPTRLLSRFVGCLSRLPVPGFLLHPFIRWYCQYYKVNTTEIPFPLKKCKNFNQFFIRSLKKGSRIIQDTPHSILAGVDGRIQTIGTLSAGTIFQLKHHAYSLHSVLGNAGYHTSFQNGSYCILYLAPGDYHRMHAPMDGTGVFVTHIPGRLAPVNPQSVKKTTRLYATNERVNTIIKTSVGLLAHVAIGALNVGSIHLHAVPKIKTNRWGCTAPSSLEISHPLSQGEEIGWFEMGSTVLLIWDHPVAFTVEAGDPIQWNHSLGTTIQNE